MTSFWEDGADVEALKASVEGLFAEALRGGAARPQATAARGPAAAPGAAAAVAAESEGEWPGLEIRHRRP